MVRDLAYCVLVVLQEMASARGVRAVIVGGTGECGRHILGEIVCSPVGNTFSV